MLTTCRRREQPSFLANYKYQGSRFSATWEEAPSDLLCGRRISIRLPPPQPLGMQQCMSVRPLRRVRGDHRLDTVQLCRPFRVRQIKHRAKLLQRAWREGVMKGSRKHLKYTIKLSVDEATLRRPLAGFRVRVFIPFEPKYCIVPCSLSALGATRVCRRRQTPSEPRRCKEPPESSCRQRGVGIRRISITG